MKILFLDWKCFNKDDTILALKGMGHDIIKFISDGYNDKTNEDFTKKFETALEKNGVDCIFSYNYFPIVAQSAKNYDIPYISFLYDNPYVYLYSYTLMYDTNHIFLFDRSWVNEFNQGGLKNVHYMVLPGNPDRINTLPQPKDMDRTRADVSFVGALYNEKHNFYERLSQKASPYLLGYLDGVIEAQQLLFGSSIVESALTDDIIDMLRSALPVDEDPMGVEPRGYRYANYFIKRKITQVERMRYLTALGERFGEKDIKLFTVDPDVSFKGVKNMGVTPYETEMPFVFKNSKINLNISLRSINTGIPLRCIDIMSRGGFLLSNYQEDLAIDFIPGEDFDYYGDIEDMLTKIEYYLSHENERKEIAKNGQEKVRQYYSFEKVFERIFDIVFGEINV